MLHRPSSIFAVVAEPASRSATAPRRYVELREIALLSTLPAVVCSFCSSSPLTIVCRRGGSQLSVLSSPFLRRLASNDLKIREQDCPHDDPSTRASHNPSLYPDLPSFSRPNYRLPPPDFLPSSFPFPIVDLVSASRARTWELSTRPTSPQPHLLTNSHSFDFSILSNSVRFCQLGAFSVFRFFDISFSFTRLTT